MINLQTLYKFQLKAISLLLIALSCVLFFGFQLNGYANTDDINAKFLENAEAGNVQALQSNLKSGAQILSEDEWGATALIKASSGGHLSVVKKLIAVDPSAEHLKKVDLMGSTALHAAASEAKADIVRVLLEALINDSSFVSLLDSTERTALHLAVENNNLEVVKLLIDYDSSEKHLLQKNENGQTALHIAVSAERSQIVEELLRANSSYNHLSELDGLKRTAFMLAEAQDSMHIALKLFKYGKEYKKELFMDCMSPMFCGVFQELLNQKSTPQTLSGDLYE